MRILLDIQTLQTPGCFRGIGRFTVNHAKAFIKQNKDDEIFLFMNDSKSGTLEYIRKEFSNLIPDDHIIICPYPLSIFDNTDSWFNAIESEAFRFFELIREVLISKIHPDFILIYSHFEFAFSSTSIKKYIDIPTGVIVHDFIPYHDKMFSGFLLDFYNEKLKSLESADFLMCVSDYTSRDTKEIIKSCNSGVISVIGEGSSDFWKKIEISEEEKKAFLDKFGLNKEFILYAGGVDERKNVKRLIEAYSQLSGNIKEKYSLFIICGKYEEIQKELEKYAISLNLNNHVVFAGYVSNEDLRISYNLCKLFVFPSLSEGFGLTPLEALSCGTPVIGSCRTSIPEVIGMERALFEPEEADSIYEKINEALSDNEFYSELKNHSLIQAAKFSWDSSAEKSWNNIKKLFSEKSHSYEEISEDRCIELASEVLNNIQSKDSIPETLLIEISECIANIYEYDNVKQKSIFLELSVLDTSDAGTGIQRVSKNINKYLPSIANEYDVIPVRLAFGGGYEYSRKLSSKIRETSFVYPSRGDLFFFPELSMEQISGNLNYFLHLKERGVVLLAMVHDLIPINYSNTCQDAIKQAFPNYISQIALFNGVICNSRSTESDFNSYLKKNIPERYGECKTDWFHLGSDLEQGKRLKEADDIDEKVLSELRKRKTFLMVSTIEPRKKYEQVLSAFELLWNDSVDVNLVFVGKKGWKVDELIKKIDSHRENGKRLFWLPGISDLYLDKVYNESDCFIMASLTEGFGLGITEAAYRKKPLIIRDIPIFREIANDNAFYFEGMEGIDLAKCIKRWLKLYNEDKHPKSDNIKSLTWKASVEMLFDRLKKYL